MPKIIDDRQVYRGTMETIVACGYAGATTKQLAQAAGISEVTLFRKYGNKAQLVRQAMIALGEQSDFEAGAQYTGDVHADLLRLVKMYHGSAEQNGRFFYTILVESARHPELADALDLLQVRLRVAGQLFARYQADGVLKPAHPIHALASLIGPLIALNMMQGAPQGVPLPPIDLERHVANFIEGHRA